MALPSLRAWSAVHSGRGYRGNGKGATGDVNGWLGLRFLYFDMRLVLFSSLRFFTLSFSQR